MYRSLRSLSFVIPFGHNSLTTVPSLRSVTRVVQSLRSFTTKYTRIIIVNFSSEDFSPNESEL